MITVDNIIIELLATSHCKTRLAPGFFSFLKWQISIKKSDVTQNLVFRNWAIVIIHKQPPKYKGALFVIRVPYPVDRA